MKKILILMIAMLSIFSLAFAAEVNETKNTEQVIDKSIIKLEKLELAVQKHILSSQVVVDKVPSNESNETLVELINQFENLRSEILSVLDYVDEYNATQLDVEFELFKEDAVSITNEFRKTAQDIIPQEVHNELRSDVQNKRFGDVEEKKKEIQNRIHQHNAKVVQIFLQRFGLENQTFEDQVKNGTMNVGQAISSLAKEFRGLGNMKKDQVRSELHEEQVRGQIREQKIRESMQERRETQIGRGFEPRMDENMQEQRSRRQMPQRPGESVNRDSEE